MNTEPLTAHELGEIEIDQIKKIANAPELLEVARKAIEDELIERRDIRLSVMRNNGLVIAESDGERSEIIRMGSDEAMAIGLKAIIKHIQENGKRVLWG